MINSVMLNTICYLKRLCYLVTPLKHIAGREHVQYHINMTDFNVTILLLSLFEE